MCCTPRKWRMRPLPLLSSILSRQKTGPGMCRYHWLIFLFIVSLTLCHPHQIIGHGKNGKAHVFFFSRYKKRKILFVSILLLILVNIDSVSLTVQHFCFVLCIFQLSLNSLFSFLWFFWSYFWNIAHDSFFKPIKKSHVNLCILFYALGKGISRWNIHKVLHNKFSLATKSIHQVYRIVLSP